MKELEGIILSVVKDVARRIHEGQVPVPVSILTTDHRDRWADVGICILSFIPNSFLLSFRISTIYYLYLHETTTHSMQSITLSLLSVSTTTPTPCHHPFPIYQAMFPLPIPLKKSTPTFTTSALPTLPDQVTTAGMTNLSPLLSNPTLEPEL